MVLVSMSAGTRSPRCVLPMGEVLHAAGSAEADAALVVDAVAAEPVVAGFARCAAKHPGVDR